MAPCNCSQQPGILAIDDERGFLGMVKEMLECQGFMVHTVSNPKQAIKLYEERWREISMVLLDYFLPEMSGEMVFENLQRLNSDVRVVLLTGGEASVAEKMFQKGLRGYLKKPFGIRELGQKIRDAIDAPAVPSSASVSDISGKKSQTASVARKGGGATPVQLPDDMVSHPRRLPDTGICRTGYLGQALDLSECLVENPEGCEYAVRVGTGIYCHHADRRSFEKTVPPLVPPQ
jgi:CheY-like chemotaxis protein